MTVATDRRAVLGAILTASASLSVAAWGSTNGSVADPVVAAIERHRLAYEAFITVWSQTSVMALYDRAKADSDAAVKLQRFRELETEEEAAFSALLATRPATKASAIACVKHVADCGLATDEMRSWLAMLMESPLVN
jgi:hypothetical protein